MWKKFLIIVMAAWLLIFAVDILTSFTIHHPIFTIQKPWPDVRAYLGLGYTITFDQGLVPVGFQYDSTPHINPWIYIYVNAGFILLLGLSSIVSIVKRRKK